MTQVENTGQVGPQQLSDGATGAAMRQDRTGGLVVSRAMPTFYELCNRGQVFSDGMALTAINNATFTTATTGATVTPVAGIFNPSGSGVNCVIIEVSLSLVMTALAATGPGGFTYMTATGQNAISTGSTPLNRKTLAPGGAQAKGLTNVAPTGLTGAFVARFGSSLGGGSAENTAFTATAVAMQTQATAGKELFDGSLFVPPGGALVLVANTTPVAHSATSAIVWAEVSTSL